MDWVSVVLVAILAFLTWRAFRNGFVRELVTLGAAILAIPVAGVLYGKMYPKVVPIVDNEPLARLVAFLSIFFAVLIGGQVAAHLLKRTVNMLNLGVADDLAGALFGFVKAMIICQVLLIALVAFPDPDFRDSIDESPVAGALLDAAPPVLSVLPGRFDQAVHLFLDSFDVNPTASLDAKPTSTPTPRGTTGAR
jgi:uncharacterized membrane protein required for colicin V production